MTFDQFLHLPRIKPALALFFGPRCVPCERLKPKLRAECSDAGIELCEFDASLEQGHLRGLGVRSVPAVIVVSTEGEAQVLFCGDKTLEEIKELLNV